MKILITGGTGFIGSHLAEKLINNKLHILTKSENLDNIKKIKNKVKIIKIDILDDSFLELLKNEKYDIIFHLASDSKVPESLNDPIYDCEINLKATIKILECLKNNNLSSKLIYASSVAVYGNQELAKENSNLNPLSPYGINKLASEHYIRAYSNLYDLNAISLRIFSTYGPRLKKQAIYDFITKFKKNPEKMEIIGDGKQKRDLIFIKDLVDGIILVANNADFKGEIYNIGTGEEHSVIEIAKTLAKTMNIHPKFIFTESQKGNFNRCLADISKIKKMGFKIKYSLEQGLKKTVDWHDLINNSNI